MGPPEAICFLKRGTTDPEEPKTFPNLTIENLLFFDLALPDKFKLWLVILSANDCRIS